MAGLGHESPASGDDRLEEYLVDSLHLEKADRLRELGLTRVRLRSLMWTLLYDEWTHRVERLSLVECDLDSGCLDALFAWPGLRTLKALDLRDNRIGADGVVRLHAALGDRVRLGAQDNRRWS